MNKNLISLVLFLFFLQFSFAQQSELSVEKIMQDPSWMGTYPSNIRWGSTGDNIYFNYNLEKDPADSLYKINIQNRNEIVKVHWEEEDKLIPSRAATNDARTLKVYTEDNTLIIYDLKNGKKRELLNMGESINDPKFLANEDIISFSSGNNAFIYNLKNGNLRKLTNIRSGEDRSGKKEKTSEKDQWLEKENIGLLKVVQQRKEKEEATKAFREKTGKKTYSFYSGDKRVTDITVSPDLKYVTFRLISRTDDESTNVPDYVDASGYTVDLPARSKVGNEPTKVELAIYNLEKDSVYFTNMENLPGISDLPDYTKDYPEKDWEEKVREVIPSEAYFSEDGSKAVINVRSHDNKDRWIALLDLSNGELKSLDRQRDEAWIAGPGIGYKFGGGTLGWLPDGQHIYFQSEDTGYSHLYLLNTKTGDKKQLTKGNFEVFDPFLSNNGRYFFLTTSQIHPGERHFYKMPLKGGKMQQLTSMTGNNEVHLSPDEKYMAILHSYSNKPWELYLKKTSENSNAMQLTSGQSQEFESYEWREPEVISFKAEDGALVPARLYKPEESTKNGAAVIFVHGAGYLQNAHKWWSSYFREYMFHNLLADLGYTVLDIDYRGSAGYGRDWRTAIYRHMGGKDLSDQVDGANYLISQHNIDPDKIGIYGGSYGGFITLMAMFNEPDTFESGAALRSVTDWAHYNHGYTSNILNEPSQDPIAYRRSSPIYFAEGLEGNLLIAHGMVDVNVHFQDVVRLAQRLVELEKDNWEMAVYPVEGHGFVEPSSWTDEYKRILKLFNETLLD
ncbi:S9 family peptidase [Salinimicrobium sp. GXAS 041]|uniref:S9 family peptidase n=1 Tax=Salinimicrobium sp. GXAS 041 TaxID=3400806 RepID=UPI003C763B33